MAKFTIFGATGLVGSALEKHLSGHGHEIFKPEREGFAGLCAPGLDLGHVIYCIGLTADFRSRPGDAIEAHVTLPNDLMRGLKAESFLYLSSTRVYDGAAETSEATTLSVKPSADHLYNLSKLTGEALILSRPTSTFRVARLSNVIGAGKTPVMFLASVTDEARRIGRVEIRTAPSSAKDYVSLDYVTATLASIALTGKERLYNVASGVNTSNEEIAKLLRSNFGAEVTFAPGAPSVTFPIIDTKRVSAEFGSAVRPFLELYESALRRGEI